MGRAARIARRHGLGGVVRTYRQALPFWFHPLSLGIIVVILGALALNQDLGIGAKIAGASVPVLFTLIAWWMLADVRMVLCEGGIVIGRFFPLLAPYVVPYGAIEPRGVTCVSDVGRLRVATGRSYGSTLFHFAHSRRGVVFDGPRRPALAPATCCWPRRSMPRPTPCAVARCGPSRTAAHPNS